MKPEQLELEHESFAVWFEREFPDWCVLVGELREAGQDPDSIERVLRRLCYARGIHPLFVVGAMAWMNRRYGVKVYIAPVRFN